jgi:peptidoglycan/LPS O-acetylase OafA/YrhL
MWDEKYRNFPTPLRTFLLSRYLRLMPTLILAILIYVVVRLIFADPSEYKNILEAITPVWVTRTFLILGSFSQKTFLGPKWSIDIEMQFYLLAGCFFVLFPGRLKVQSAIILFSVLVMTFLATLSFYNYPSKVLFPYLGLFFAGVCIYKFNIRPSKTTAIWSVTLFLVLSALLVVQPDWRHVIIGGGDIQTNRSQQNQIYSFVGALLILPYLAHSLWIKSNRFDFHLGNLAYPLYLFHMTPVFIYRHYFNDLPPTQRVFQLFVTYIAIALGTLAIYFFFDQRVDAYRKKLLTKSIGRPS